MSQVKYQQLGDEQPQNEWDGHLCTCFGKSETDRVAWAGGFFAPMFMIAVNLRNAFKYNILIVLLFTSMLPYIVQVIGAILYGVIAIPEVIKCGSNAIEQQCTGEDGELQFESQECMDQLNQCLAGLVKAEYDYIYNPLFACGVAMAIFLAIKRTHMRKKFGLPGSCCCDFLSYFFCTSCTVCMDTRFLWKNNVVDGELLGKDAGIRASPWSEPVKRPNAGINIV